jgi:hypothetical protein
VGAYLAINLWSNTINDVEDGELLRKESWLEEIEVIQEVV